MGFKTKFHMLSRGIIVNKIITVMWDDIPKSKREELSVVFTEFENTALLRPPVSIFNRENCLYY